MKSLTVKKAIILTACLFMIPTISFAAQKATPMTHKKASVVACEGKKAGDAVTLMMKGKKVNATCQDVKGVMKAVVNAKK